jgi:isocitrate/isopropylmalate dehydrogenase
VAVIGGDGIGPEVLAEATKVLLAAAGRRHPVRRHAVRITRVKPARLTRVKSTRPGHRADSNVIAPLLL